MYFLDSLVDGFYDVTQFDLYNICRSHRALFWKNFRSSADSVNPSYFVVFPSSFLRGSLTKIWIVPRADMQLIYPDGHMFWLFMPRSHFNWPGIYSGFFPSPCHTGSCECWVLQLASATSLEYKDQKMSHENCHHLSSCVLRPTHQSCIVYFPNLLSDKDEPLILFKYMMFAVSIT